MRILLFFTLILTACTQEKTPSNKLVYFDLISVLNKQIDLLNQEKPIFIKKYSIGNQIETANTREIDWNKELELFLQTDLNKKSYQNSYTIATSGNEYTYTLKKDENLPVKWVKVKFNAEEVSLFAKIHVDNYLYTSDKDISLKIKKEKLQEYRIKGWQKLLIGDKKGYEIEGKLVQN